MYFIVDVSVHSIKLFCGTETAYFSDDYLSLATIRHSVLMKHKQIQVHSLRFIPVENSCNSDHFGKRRERSVP